MKKRYKRRVVAWLLVFMMLFSNQPMYANAKTKGKLIKPTIVKVVSKKDGELTIRYKKVSKALKCQIQVSTDKKYKKNVQSKVIKGTGKAVTYKNLKKGTYYVRMRSFESKKKKKTYSAWSAIKKIKVNTKKATASDKKNDSISDTDKSHVNRSIMTDEDLMRAFWDSMTDQSQNASAGNNSSNGSNSTGSNTSTGNNNTGNNGTDQNDSSTGDNTGGDSKEDQLPANISNAMVYTSDFSSIYYNGEPKCPSVYLYMNGYSLMQERDYVVNYENNINAGTAVIRVTGIGNYTGELTRTFEINKAMPEIAHYSRSEAVVGQSLPIAFDKEPEGKCTYTISDYDGDDQTEKYTKYNESGELVATRSGVVNVEVKIAESANYCSSEYRMGELTICDDENPEGGFYLSAAFGEDTYKSTIKGTTVENEIGTFSISYKMDASDDWIDQHIRFEAEDASPSAYSKAFRWLGLDTTAPEVKSESATSELRKDDRYGRDKVVGACVSQKVGYSEKLCLSARKLTITAGVGVRVCKVKAYKDDVLYDVIYVATKPYDKDDNYLDQDYYAIARHKVEAKLWKDGMTNLEKLRAIATYIKNTTHYPGYGCTKKEKNPTFWNAFSVDGIDLYFYMYSGMSTLNRLMDLQGGITTCLASDVVEIAATDDLGLPYLYDDDTNTIADGEGVWLGQGSYSSNPSEAQHVSVVYKDANENRTFIDAQGMMVDSSCEKHACLDQVIRD